MSAILYGYNTKDFPARSVRVYARALVYRIYMNQLASFSVVLLLAYMEVYIGFLNTPPPITRT